MVLEGRADMDDLESRVAQLLEHLIVDDLFDSHDFEWSRRASVPATDFSSVVIGALVGRLLTD